MGTDSRVSGNERVGELGSWTHQHVTIVQPLASPCIPKVIIQLGLMMMAVSAGASDQKNRAYDITVDVLTQCECRVVGHGCHGT